MSEKKFFGFAKKIIGLPVLIEKKLFKAEVFVSNSLEKRGLSRANSTKTGKALSFLAMFSIVFLLLNFLSSFLVLLLEQFISFFVSVFLLFFGVSSKTFLQEPVLINASNGQQIIISYLCTGLLETSVLVSSIYATKEINIHKRIFGILAGVFFVFVFNITRIFVTLYFALFYMPAIVEFAHNFLFRIALFFSIAGIYGAWLFIFSTKK